MNWWSGVLAASVTAACGSAPTPASTNSLSRPPAKLVGMDALPNSLPETLPADQVTPIKPVLLPKDAQLEVETTATNADYRFMAVGPDGTAYALKNTNSMAQLYASTDNARTWSKRGAELDASIRTIAVLTDGVLLADLEKHDGGGHVIARSEDKGAHWDEVLPIGPMSMLTPHSVDELNGVVFFGEYQAYTNESVPIHLWASTDRGRTWTARQVFDNRRHAHGVRANRATGELWVFFGDNDVRTGMARSTDGGWTFEKTVIGKSGSAVDAVFTEKGMIFGQDVVFGADPSYIQVLGADDTPRQLYALPGPSYSITTTPIGGLIATTTREPAGDVYLPGDDSAHLLVSPDGQHWTDLMTFNRCDLTGYGRANIYWTLATGEMVLQVSDVEPIGDGYGYMLLKARRVQ